AKTVPGVASVAVAGTLPTRVIGLRTAVHRTGEARPAQQMTWRSVSPEYFETTGIPLVAGRLVANTDTARSPRIAIRDLGFLVSFPIEGSPVGLRLTTSFSKEPLTVVGVAGDVTPAGEPDRPALYVPLDQSPIGGGYLIVRTLSDPRPLMPLLAARLRNSAP